MGEVAGARLFGHLGGAGLSGQPGWAVRDVGDRVGWVGWLGAN